MVRPSAGARAFRRGDFLGDHPSLAERARDLTRNRIGRRPTGPTRVLANPRYLGVGFNPISLFFLYSEDGTTIESVIAEVTSTPWRERIAYVLDGRSRGEDGAIRGSFEKGMHVSPFQPMDQTYEISVREPGDELRVAVRNLEAGREVLTASMTLRRRELTSAPTDGSPRPLSADDARDSRPDLRERPATEAEGPTTSPPPAIAGEL